MDKKGSTTGIIVPEHRQSLSDTKLEKVRYVMSHGATGAFVMLGAVLAMALLVLDSLRRGDRDRKFFVRWKPVVAGILAFSVIVLPSTLFRTPSAAYDILVFLALFMAVVGDVLLTQESKRCFLLGMGCFAVTHVLLTIAFSLGVTGGPAWWSFLVLVGDVAAGSWIGMHAGRLRIPVFLYTVALMLMSFMALWRWYALGGDSALLAMIGALLFVASDMLLGIRRFVLKSESRLGHSIELTVYWLAVGCIAVSTW